MKFFKYIVSLAIFLSVVFLGFGFSVMNDDVVALSLLPSVTFDLSVAMLVFVCLIVGLLLGTLLVSISLFGQKLKTGKANRQLKKIEKEVEGLRAVTLEK